MCLDTHVRDCVLRILAARSGIDAVADALACGRSGLAAAVALDRFSSASDLGRSSGRVGAAAQQRRRRTRVRAGLVFSLSVLARKPDRDGARSALVCVALIAALAVFAPGSRSAYLSGAIGAWTLLVMSRARQSPRLSGGPWRAAARMYRVRSCRVIALTNPRAGPTRPVAERRQLPPRDLASRNGSV